MVLCPYLEVDEGHAVDIERERERAREREARERERERKREREREKESKPAGHLLCETLFPLSIGKIVPLSMTHYTTLHISPCD